MLHQRFSLLVAVLAVFVIASPRAMTPASQAAPGDSNWSVEPDPPESGKDLDVSYDGDEPDIDEAVYYVDDGPAVRVKLGEDGKFTIPASKLKGKSYLKLWARGAGEAGVRIIRLSAPK